MGRGGGEPGSILFAAVLPGVATVYSSSGGTVTGLVGGHGVGLALVPPEWPLIPTPMFPMPFTPLIIERIC